ncbi:Topoisomerase 1-associated factor 1 [Maudiozyma exigua]|uniref:Topoisomerase 1-associated factor 1 n=1 Tax=Maudiozyma exigua TaxID=34358 RepID=A0A9P6W949_MAUEX|nr:Topoisomerase 1-associated factor 1 [Kazachstania exigua]
MTEVANPSVILKARIALLSTSIGGPDYSADNEEPRYKLGDEALLCLKDLKRWFKLVDDEQNRLDVAMATAEYKILTDDLIPILIEWEDKASQKKTMGKGGLVGKSYYDKIALQCLQLMVLMTWPLILTDQSTVSQVNNYAEVKKYQLVYKKAILSTQDGKVLKAIVRLVTNIMRIDRLNRSPHDNMVIKLALNFFRNVIAIEPGELTITNKKKTPKGINATDTLPPGVSHDDISLNSVVSCFHKNKVFKLLLTLSSSMTSEFDQDFINVPLLEIMTYLTKDIDQDLLIQSSDLSTKQNGTDTIKGVYRSRPNMELSELLKKETKMKKNLIKHTSSRHSRFGAMISIETSDKRRYTVTGNQNLLDEASTMDKIDSRKKWNKRQQQKKQDPMEEGLPDGFLNTQTGSFPLLNSTTNIFLKFLNNFIDSSFNILLHSINNYFTTEMDRIVTLEQIEYLLFIAWFIRYQIARCHMDPSAEISVISEILEETTCILICQLLRTSNGMKNWPVVHASMISFNGLITLLREKMVRSNKDFDTISILNYLFNSDRLQLLTSLPRTAHGHSEHYLKTVVHLTHSVLKVLQENTENPYNKQIPQQNGKILDSEPPLASSMDLDENNTIDVDFLRVQSNFINDPTIDTYINFLQRFRELDHQSIKEVVSFFHRILTKAKEETFLFRLDLVVLLRDILDSTFLARNSKSRRYVEDFSNYFLHRLKKRLKVSPAWFVGLLFPSLHDSQVGYFQRYGEQKIKGVKRLFGVTPTMFKLTDDEDGLPIAVLRDMKIGILVSTIIDNGDDELIHLLQEHLRINLSFWDTALHKEHTDNGDTNLEKDIPKTEFVLPPVTRKHLLTDGDFRALLVLLDFQIPAISTDKCCLNKDCNYRQLQNDYDSFSKYMKTPFETPNGLPSSSYLVKNKIVEEENRADEDGWNGNEEYDYGDPSIIRDEDYFRALDENMEHKLKGKSLRKGLAKSKKVKKTKKSGSRGRRSNIPTFTDGEEAVELAKPGSHYAVASKEYISDSDDEEGLSSIFYENEVYLRYLLEKNNKTLSPEQSSMYAKFRNERVANNGSVTSDFKELFGGPIPSLDQLKQFSSETLAPNMLLHDMSAKKLDTPLNEEEGAGTDLETSDINMANISQKKQEQMDSDGNETDSDMKPNDEDGDEDDEDGSLSKVSAKTKKRSISEISDEEDDADSNASADDNDDKKRPKIIFSENNNGEKGTNTNRSVSGIEPDASNEPSNATRSVYDSLMLTFDQAEHDDDNTDEE